MSDYGAATIVDLLRGIHLGSWAEITEPGGWSYSTNIGLLANQAADEIERLTPRAVLPNDDMTETTDKNKAAIAALDAYLADPETDPSIGPIAWEQAREDRVPFRLRHRQKSSAPVLRTAALLLGLCTVTGAAAFVAATGGGVGWTVAVFGVLAAEFALGYLSGRGE